MFLKALGGLPLQVVFSALRAWVKSVIFSEGGSDLIGSPLFLWLMIEGDSYPLGRSEASHMAFLVAKNLVVCTQ